MAVGMEDTGKCLTVRPGSLKDSEMLWHFCREQTQEEFQMWGADFVYQYPPEKEQMKNSLAWRMGIRKEGDEAALLGKGVDHEGKVLFLTVCLNEIPIGFAEITPVNRNFEKGVLSRLILDPAYRGKGLGKLAVKAILDYGFGKMSLNEIWLIVYKENQRARKCYETCGFQVQNPLIRPGRPEALEMCVKAPSFMWT